MAIGRAGVLVFESKDYGGWIYGGGNQRNWTQVLDFGREKHQFYNLVKQNAMHVRALAAAIGREVPIYSLVVFGRDATLKN